MYEQPSHELRENIDLILTKMTAQAHVSFVLHASVHMTKCL